MFDWNGQFHQFQFRLRQLSFVFLPVKEKHDGISKFFSFQKRIDFQVCEDD